MKIFHPLHRTAWSRRTSGMPLRAVTKDGRVVKIEGGARKHPGYLEVPDDTTLILWFYTTTGGYRQVHVLQAVHGLPDLVVVENKMDPEEARRRIEGALPSGMAEAARRAIVEAVEKWLWEGNSG